MTKEANLLVRGLNHEIPYQVSIRVAASDQKHRKCSCIPRNGSESMTGEEQNNRSTDDMLCDMRRAAETVV